MYLEFIFICYQHILQSLPFKHLKAYILFRFVQVTVSDMCFKSIFFFASNFLFLSEQQFMPQRIIRKESEHWRKEKGSGEVRKRYGKRGKRERLWKNIQIFQFPLNICSAYSAILPKKARSHSDKHPIFTMKHLPKQLFLFFVYFSILCVHVCLSFDFV